MNKNDGLAIRTVALLVHTSLPLVTLLGFSLREEYGIEGDAPFLPTEEYFAERKGQLANISYDL